MVPHRQRPKARRNCMETAPDPEVAAADRTRVIIISQVVVVAALLVVWSIIRCRRSAPA